MGKVGEELHFAFCVKGMVFPSKGEGIGGGGALGAEEVFEAWGIGCLVCFVCFGGIRLLCLLVDLSTCPFVYLFTRLSLL